jgi:hypothetical protein
MRYQALNDDLLLLVRLNLGPNRKLAITVNLTHFKVWADIWHRAPLRTWAAYLDELLHTKKVMGDGRRWHPVRFFRVRVAA